MVVGKKLLRRHSGELPDLLDEVGLIVVPAGVAEIGERGPVFLECPQDVLKSQYPEEALGSKTDMEGELALDVLPIDLEASADLVDTDLRPLCIDEPDDPVHYRPVPLHRVDQALTDEGLDDVDPPTGCPGPGNPIAESIGLVGEDIIDGEAGIGHL